MNRINIANPEFEYDDEDPEGFRSGMHRIGPKLGAKQMGTSVYEIPPGQALCPYHYEYAEEEWLLVLIGRPTLRDPEGDDRARALGRGDVRDRAEGRPRHLQPRAPSRCG